MTQPRKIRYSRPRAREGLRSSALVAGGSVLLLLLGFAAGWFARPYFTGGGGAAAPALQTQTPPPGAATTSPGQATREALMQMLIARTRHWIGSETAPVTMLDMSDFQ